MEPLISVCIPTYREGKYIVDTINRLTQQTSWPWSEIVIADYDPDKSKDTVNAILDGCKPHLEQIKHVAVPKSGIGVARHMACMAAKGRFIINFDADCRFAQQNAIDHLIKPLMRGHYVVTHCPNVIKPEELDNIKTMDANKMYQWRSILINPLSPVLVFECGMTFTKEAYAYTGGFDDVVVGEAPLLGIKFMYTFGTDRMLQINNVIVETSGRRAIGSSGGVILDMDYNHAYR